MKAYRHTEHLTMALVASSALLFLLHNISGHAPLHMDAAFFTTAVLNLAQGNELVFDSYTDYLLKMGNRYDFHGILYPWLFGLFFGISNYESLFVAHGIFIAATITVVYFFFRQATGSTQPTTTQLLLSAMLAFYTGFIAVNLQGRPELVALPFISGCYFLLRRGNLDAKLLASLFALATLAFLSSPQVGILLFTIIIVRLGFEYTLADFLIRTSLMMIFATGATAIFLLHLDSDLLTWLQRMWAAGAGNPTKNWLRLFAMPALASFSATNLVVFILLIGTIIALARSHRPVLILLLLPAIYILIPNANSYIYMVVLPFALHYVLTEPRSSRWGTLLYASVLLLTAFHILGVVRYTLLAASAHSEGRSFQVARAELQSAIRLEDSDVVAFDWMATHSYIAFSSTKAGQFWLTAQSSLYESGQDELLSRYLDTIKRRLKYIIIPEKGHWKEPPKLCIKFDGDSYFLILNRWSRRRAELYGLRLGGAAPGYYYALYERRECPASQTK